MERRLDDLAPAGRAALPEGGEDSDGQVETGGMVGDRKALYGRLVGWARDTHGAARRLGDHVESPKAGVGPVGPEALAANTIPGFRSARTS